MIGVLSIVATTSISTPAFAAIGVDYVSRGKTTVYSGATTQATVESAQQKLNYGFNVINNDPYQIFYANEQGVKQTGWIHGGGGWYYADTNGVVQRSKWIQPGDGNWYYLGADGEMLSDYIVDGYYVNKSGAWSTMKTIDEYGRQIRTYSRVSIANTTISVQEFEAGISSGKIKVKVIHGNVIGATKDGDGVLIYYYA